MTAESSSKQKLLHGSVIFLGYIIATELSYIFYTAPASFPIQSGVALAGLVLGGISLWPAVFLATLGISLWHGQGPLLALAFAVGNTAQASFGAYVLRRINFNPLLERMRDIFGVMLVAMFASMIVPAVGLIGYKTREIFGGAGLPIPWGAWWVGHILSLLIVAPFLIRWISEPPFRRAKLRPAKEYLEIFVAFGALIAINFTIFVADVGQIRGVPLVYLLLVPLFWIALRFGASFTTLAILLTSIISLGGVMTGDSLPARMSLGEQLFLSEIFLEVIAAIFLILTAVTSEKKHANKVLKSHVVQLEEALLKIRSEDRAKNEFIATLAHELRNPLAPLVSSLELLRLGGPNTPEFPQLIKIMEGRLGTMAQLLDDLLDISRISQRKLHLKKVLLNAADAVVNSAQSVDAFMRKRMHTLSVAMPSGETLLLEADPIRIEQILINLLNNAAKYTNPGGNIELALKKEGGDLVASVKDNGIGISSDMLSRIFEPFLQANDRHGSGGIGIGLALTKQLVELHGGTIEARSEGPEQGSEFIVRLPLAQDSKLPLAGEVGRASNAETPSGAKSTLNILIVDDNEAAAETLGKLLELRGHRVKVAFSGQSALQEIAEFDPHAVLMDIGLPDINGYELARRMRQEQKSDFALIAVSGFGQERDKEEARAAGFDHHLTKPVSLSELEAIFTALLKEES